MNRSKTLLALGGSLVMGMAGVANADENADLRAQLQQVQARLAQIEGQQANPQLDQRRAEEVKSLIREVLADADTRASLMAEGAVAGYDKGFFIGSADSAHKLGIWGQVQFRYVFNFEQPTASSGDEGNLDNDDDGFTVRRAKLGFKGYTTVGRKWDYEIVLALDQSTSGAGIDEDTDLPAGTASTSDSVMFEDVKIGTAISENFRVDGGKFKLPFLREELNSSKYFTAVERSFVNEYFTLNRAEQLQLGFNSEMINAAFAISDGSNSEFSQIGADAVEIALTARVDVKVMGEWKQLSDYTAWSGEPNALFLGAAVHWEEGDGNQDGQAVNVPPDADYFAWTVDGSLEMQGISFSAALIGGHIESDSAAATDRDMTGLVLMAAYNISDTIEPFVRYEWIDPDVAGVDDFQFLTFGANYFFGKSHAAKFTVDVVLILEADVTNADGDVVNVGNPYGASTTSRSLGFSGDGADEDTVLLRLQWQLLF